MSDKFKMPDAETRARSIASLREAGRLLDLCTLDLDEVIAALEKDLREQRRARLLRRANPVSGSTIES